MKNFNNKSKTKRNLNPRHWALVCQCRNLKNSILLLFFIISGTYQMAAQSPLEANGQLSVVGTHLVNEAGTPIQLRGMSSHGLQWHNECYNFNSLSVLVDKWGIDVFRMAMAPSLEKDSWPTTIGYEGNPDFWKKYIDNLVDECGRLGIYCIIDWHILAPVTDPSDPNVYPTMAKEFWNYMSSKHAGKKQVIYEICNEPSGVNWSGPKGIKSYADTIITLIRKNDSKAVILVGNPGWSADLKSVADDPLTGDTAKNVMYTLHFYAASHKQERRDMITTALGKGLPVFVSEWGTTTFTGDGTIDYPETDTWLSFMKANNLSWCNWDYSDDANTPASSALKPGAAALANWNETTAEGDSIRKYISTPDSWSTSGHWMPVAHVYIPNNRYIAWEYTSGYYLTNGMVRLQATGFSKNNKITSIDFFADDTKIGTGVILDFGPKTYHAEFQWFPTVAKNYVITAIAKDETGANSYFSAPITVQVVDKLPVSTPYPDANAPASIPGTINCANFDQGGEMVAYHDLDSIHKEPTKFGFYRPDDAVDIEKKNDLLDVGYVISGEWMNYTVNIKQSGLYSIVLTSASALAGPGIFHIELDGQFVSNYFYKIPSTGNWDTQRKDSITGIPFSAGVHVLRLYTDVGNLNYYTMKFDYLGGSIHTITTTATGGGTVVPASEDVSTPCGTFIVANGDLMQILSWPYYGNIVNDIEVDGDTINTNYSKGGSDIVDFLKVTANHTVHTTFKKYQSVSFSMITPNSDGSYAAQGSSSSGLPVIFTSSDPSVASITSQGIITLHKSGTFTITASQTGDSTYASSDIAKTTVSKTLTVTTISATAGTGGTISPSDNSLVLAGTDKVYTITPSVNYKITDVLVDGVSQGPITSYTFSNITVAHTISATFAPLCTLAKLFGVPRATALPTFTATFMHAYVIGTGGPNLTTVNTLAINWDLANKGLYNCAFNFNASPWYLSLIPLTTNTFASASPSCTIKGSGITGLDGSYYVNWDGTHFILVSKTGNFAIYGSNAATAPAGCPLLKDAIAESIDHGSLDLFPNPVDRNNAITINLGSVSSDGAKIIIMDLSGKLVYSNVLRSSTNSLNLGGKISSGLYIVKVINGNEQYNAKLIVR
jgi:hypothetical protein